MSVEIIDSFENVVQADFANKWDVDTTSTFVQTSGPTPRTGSQCMGINNNGRLHRQLPANQGTLIMGFAWRANSIGGDAGEIFGFRDNASTQIDFRPISGGGGTAKVTRNGTQLGSTISTVLNPAQWTHIQIKVVFHTSTGSVEVKYNDVSVFSVSGVNTAATGNNYANRIFLGYGFGGNGSGTTTYFDDFYCFNGAGSINNDFGGDLKVLSAVVSGNGTVQNFTRSTGSSNVANVSESTPNSDTNYNYSSTPGDIDLYTIPAFTTAQTIKTVQVVNVVRKDDAGSRTINGVTRVASTNYVGTGTSYTVQTAYASGLEQFETNPNTSAAWTQSGVNAAEFGLKVIA